MRVAPRHASAFAGVETVRHSRAASGRNAAFCAVASFFRVALRAGACFVDGMKHPLLRPAFALLCTLAATALPARAADLEPTLGTKGKLLLEERFQAATVPAGWNKNTGKISVADGTLHLSQIASDNHIGAFRKLIPLQNCVVQLDFKFDGATVFQLGFDPAPGELKKKGHLFALAITPTGWMVTENPDKADTAAKNVTHAKAATKFAPGQWFTLLLEMKGDQVVAHVEGKEPLKAKAKDFHVKKPGLVLRSGGKDGQDVLIDNVQVWELL